MDAMRPLHLAVRASPDNDFIDRTTVNAWDDRRVADAVKATGRKKPIFAGYAWTSLYGHRIAL